MVTSKQLERCANLVAVGGLVGVALSFKYPVAGTVLILGPGVALLLYPLVGRVKRKEKFLAEYGSYEGFRARAHEVVDYERLFRCRDTGSRRRTVGFLTRHVRNMPRSYAARFLDSLTENDRPHAFPDDPLGPSGRVSPGRPGAADRHPGTGGTP